MRRVFRSQDLGAHCYWGVTSSRLLEGKTKEYIIINTYAHIYLFLTWSRQMVWNPFTHTNIFNFYPSPLSSFYSFSISIFVSLFSNSVEPHCNYMDYVYLFDYAPVYNQASVIHAALLSSRRCHTEDGHGGTPEGTAGRICLQITVNTGLQY